jgi:CubicO group peptidase (beta-lactamase class C family)
VKPSTPFDLASVTKVVATTAMAMILSERGLLDLDIQLGAVVPEFVSEFKAAAGTPDARRGEVTIRKLLAHSSGLPAYEKLFLKHRTRDELLRAAYSVPLTADPGTRGEYSDIGFILLGVALERIAREALDRFCRKEIFAPLGMNHTTFNPPPQLRPQIAPTANEEAEEEPCASDTAAREKKKAREHSSGTQSKFRGRIIQGEVQDENAFILGGVAGHAGLFSTAEDLAKFAHAMLQCGADASSASSGQIAARELPKTSHAPKKNKISTPEQEQLLRPETIALFTKRQATSNRTSGALGWDTPSTPSQSGKYFSPQSYGHLGYTGTSLWIDAARQISVTLLTNRTWPDCSNQSIKEVRPKFHDAVIEAL